MKWLIALAFTATLLLSAPGSMAQQTGALMSQAMDQPIKMELNGPLPDAMDQITRQTGLRLEADPAVWDLLPWGRQTNISAKIDNQTLRLALEAIGRKLALTVVMKDESVELQPVAALRRLGRRATIGELQILDWLASHPADVGQDALSPAALGRALDKALAAAKSDVAVDMRVAEAAREQKSMSVPRNASWADALEVIERQSAATWYPWGNSILIMPKEERIRMQLHKPLTARYEGLEVSQVLLELSLRAGVTFQVEPGAIQRIAPEFQTIRLVLDNATIGQALESISGLTGLGYVVNAKGVYIWNQSASPSSTREPMLGLLLLPDLGIQVPLTAAKTPADVRAYIQFKIEQETRRLRRMMKEENFQPATLPATRPANDDL